MAVKKKERKAVRPGSRTVPVKASSKAGGLKAGKKVSSAFLTAEARLSRAQAIAHVGDWEWDIATNAVHWSEELFHVYGFDPGSVAPDYGLVLAQMHPESKEEFLQAIDAALKDDRPFEMDYRFFRKDGTEAELHTIGQVVRDHAGRPLSMFGIVQDITERKRVERALNESEEKYRFFLKSANDAVLIHSFDERGMPGPFTEVSDLACRWLGYSREELARMTPWDLDDPQNQGHIPQTIERLSREGQAVFETVWMKKNQERMAVEISTRTMKIRGKAYIVSLARDITERKQVEEKLAHMHDLMQYVISHAQSAIAVHDKEMRYIYVSEQYLKQYNVKEKDVIGRHHYEVFPDLPQKWRDVHQRVLAGAVEGKDEDPYVREDGSVDWTRWECRPWYERNGSIGGLIVYTEIITERKRREEALQQRERQLAESQRIAHIGSWEHDLKTGQVFWSEELFRLLGLDPKRDPADFNRFFERVHPDDQRMLKESIDRTIKQNLPFSIEYRFISPDRATRTILAQAELRSDAAGDLVVLTGTAQDITERKRSEENLRQSEQFVRNILDTVDEGFIVIDKDYCIVTANNAYCEQAGLPCNEVVGRHCYSISHKASRPCSEEGEDCAVRHVFETGEPYAVLHKHADRDGQVLYVETKAFPIKDAQGNVTTAIETINNITERHLLEEERLKTQKLESIGTLAGGIAHDFNNLLQGVFGFISMAKMTGDDRVKCTAALEEAEKALHLSVKLTNQLLTFSKGGRPVKRPTDLRSVVEGAAQFALSGSRTECAVAVSDDVWCAEVDDGQISQVIQNIVLNADQAMPMGGKVGIAMRNIETPAEGGGLPLPEGKYVEITISDTGIGIPEQYLSRIFDPYFTTKEKGSGLGLATSYSIVRNHDGIIQARSEAGKGTTFIVYLPASERAPRAQAPVAAQAPAGQYRILVMDDEEIVRVITGRLLESLQHKVAFAQNGEEAVAMYRAAREAGDPFDVVILDLTVRGGMGGAETLQKLREMDPAVRAVMSSGYSDDAVAAEFKEHGFGAFLKKPYTIEDLGAALMSTVA